MAKGHRGRGLYRNTLSYFGGLVVFMSALLILATLVWNFSLVQPSPYLGIFTYMIFPGVLGFGLLLVFIGMWRESVRRRKLGLEEALPYPRLDLNDPRQRKRFAVTLVGGGLLAVLMGFVGYNAFIFTESVTFCGRICHTVMEPEHTAYLHSPHARVRCVDCHVGSGAEWYVKSKLSGLYQVYAVTFHTYETPIPTPIKNLRPARETCEECHWPQKFYGAQLLQIPYFRYDEKNTSDQISLLVKTGGGSAKLGRSAGIHYHMIIDNTITFVTTDMQDQVIPWFKVKSSSGREREYATLDNPLSKEQLAALPRHVMDCMDCHNRPTHIFTPPDRAIDLAMNAGAIAKDLPWIKNTTAEVLAAPYPDNATATREIRNRILGFYTTGFPELSKSRARDIESAVETTQDIYNHTVFPAMKVDWKTYPENIGHRNWRGCFRCHDGRHVSSEGKVLTRECTVCHTMPQRGPIEALGALPPVTDETWHPFALKGRHAEILCSRCHSPGVRPKLDCGPCHKLDAKAPMMSDCTSCHSAPGVKLPVNDCKACHEAMKGLHRKGGHPDASCTDCHRPHAWAASGRDTCLSCHDDKKEHYKEGACAECHDFKS